MEIQNEDSIISSHELRDIVKELPKEEFFKTGLDILDTYVPIKGGDLILLGGRAGEGKSAFCISLTKKLVLDNRKCLWFSIELTPREFIERFGEDLPLFYIPKKITSSTIRWMQDKIDEAIKNFGVDVVFIDHLGMIAEEEVYKNDNAQEIIKARVQEIKKWAVQKNICIVLISEVKQETNAKRGKSFDLSDYKGSSSLGHTADTALIMQRMIGKTKEVVLNDLVDDLFPLSNEAKLWILKCRRSGIFHSVIHMEMKENGDFVEV